MSKTIFELNEPLIISVELHALFLLKPQELESKRKEEYVSNKWQ